MKHIKVYKNYLNEELSPRTYINAADKLKNLKHLTRSADLVNHFFDNNKDNNFYINTDGNSRKCYLESIVLSVPVEWGQTGGKYKDIFKYSAIHNNYYELNSKYDVYDSVTDWVAYNEEETTKYYSYKVIITFNFKDISKMGGRHDSQLQLEAPTNIYIGSDSDDDIAEISISGDKLVIPRISAQGINYSFDDRRSAMLYKKHHINFLNESKDFFKKIMDNSIFPPYEWDDIISGIKDFSLNNLYNNYGKSKLDVLVYPS